MAKTPFELRFNALELARQHLMENYYAQLELHRDSLDKFGLAPTKPATTAPVYPAPEAVLELAKQFKNFVDG